MKEDIEKLVKRKVTRSVITGVLEHKRVLAQDTPPVLIKVNKQYNSKYIPLERVEFMLDCLYTHREVVIPFAPTYIEGQVLWVVNLIVHHPVTGEKLTYSGQACVPLIAADQENHKFNHRNIPAGESFAIMNASKKIGNIFNPERNDHVDVMKDYFKKKQKDSEVTTRSVEIDRMFKLLEAAKLPAQLKLLFPKIKEMDNQELLQIYKHALRKVTKKKS
jgi:hypothetical protein